MGTANPVAYPRSFFIAVLIASTILLSFSSSGLPMNRRKKSRYIKECSNAVPRVHSIPSIFVKLKGINRRLLSSDLCSKADISILQGELSPLPNGIPTFGVHIVNLCPAGCSVSSIHVACGWFASAKLVNPKVFRRLNFNDCLVNDGKPLRGGDSLYFEYSSSFQYALRVEAAAVCK